MNQKKNYCSVTSWGHGRPPDLYPWTSAERWTWPPHHWQRTSCPRRRPAGSPGGWRWAGGSCRCSPPLGLHSPTAAAPRTAEDQSETKKRLKSWVIIGSNRFSRDCYISVIHHLSCCTTHSCSDSKSRKTLKQPNAKPSCLLKCEDIKAGQHSQQKYTHRIKSNSSLNLNWINNFTQASARPNTSEGSFTQLTTLMQNFRVV